MTVLQFVDVEETNFCVACYIKISVSLFFINHAIGAVSKI